MEKEDAGDGILSKQRKEKTEPVRVDTGLLVGEVQGGVRVFRGIPFAAPPVGDLRWKPPQPPRPWEGIREATKFGAVAPQPELHQPLHKQSEDCLFLNVWAPASTPLGERRPVFFWIHGGGWVQNSGSVPLFHGDKLARRGVVVVTINYRLGTLGRFAHPALTAESPAGAPLGNYAIMDQIAALQWVQRNIAAFGGDPANVTISGSSAGGTSSLFLMGIPSARDLFHKAIVQSCGGLRAIFDLKTVEEAGEKLARSLGVAPSQGTAALRRLGVYDVLDLRPTVATMPKPFVDGRLITDTLEGLFGKGLQSRIPLIYGGTNGESGAKELGDEIATEGAFGMQLQLAEEMSKRGQRVYLFQFTFVPPALRATTRTAPHSAAVVYSFGTMAARFGGKDEDGEYGRPADVPDGVVTEESRAISNTMMDYWVSFMRDGKPGGEGLPEWPAYSPSDRRAMVFGNYAVGAKEIPAPRSQ